MREIEFRGINNETGEFVYGWYTKLQEGARIFDAIIAIVDGEFTRFYIHDAKTIGQFTGLRDKNGAKIYEGDFVHLYGYGDYVCEYPFLELYEAAQENDIGVILGNIHQHPHLLEQKK